MEYTMDDCLEALVVNLVGEKATTALYQKLGVDPATLTYIRMPIVDATSIVNQRPEPRIPQIVQHHHLV